MTKKQTIAIAVMAAVGALLAVLMLLPKREAGEHADADHADAGHADATQAVNADADHAGASGHGHAAATHAASPDAAGPATGGEADAGHAGAAHAGAAGHADAVSAGAAGRPAAAQPEMIKLDDAQVKAAGIVLATAAPAKIGTAITLPGEIRFNEDRTAHVVPKLSGVVVSVSAELGENVKQGQVLAVVASSGLSDQRSELLSAQRRLALANTTFERERRLWQDKISAEQDYLQAKQAVNEAEIAVQNARQKLNAYGARPGTEGGQLNRLELRAPFSGVVMEKHLALGEAVKEDANVFTISDLSSVWAELAVPPRDLNRVRVGEMVVVRAAAFDVKADGKITYVGSLLGEQTRTAKARVALANPDRAWRPGLFVNVEVQAGQADVAVTVAANALQTVEDKPTLFIKTPSGFEVRHVATGRSDGRLTEVTQGLKAGERYAVANSFVLKAELGKGSTEHEH
ncbi:efflux RND transporter periplasmic adaptor subunit [Duganella aceris]|uniref:Efflux RND transporter periplasmic adaptor subunit n=1 Tax=Duganella aceris TaxID=2703883 RepID=A0ABX0FF13_9BURK|nr:efflux RND transporter periplasmic adaptor subunit [Duganella aceris]NGZ83124.1 efflux RND transporter periplasmic adaptor subunit [Duganella aceris]